MGKLQVRPIHPLLLKDAYKIGHVAQYPRGTSLVYSNFTPRGSRDPHADGVIAFGMQYLVKEYFINQLNENFFAQDRGAMVKAYKRRVDNMLGPGTNVDHIGELHELGYLPLKIKAVPEGTLVPFRVPVLTLWNTVPEFYWLTNAVETLLSNILWMPITSATTAFGYRRVFEKYAHLTGANRAFIPWQGHDFSMRGLPGIEAACLSGAAHLLSFTGTDTVPAIDFLETYYGANSDVELVGGSVPATEHAVMCMGLKAGEWETIDHLLFEVYPNAPVLSVVCDTWDFWKVVTEYLSSRRDRILARPGKFVLRPDSGDPVKIVCGDMDGRTRHEQIGLTRMLAEIFGVTTNATGFMELDPHVGWIYGDSITRARQEEILERLYNHGFASTTPVLGIGSYTYQYVTRDTYGLAMKATYGEVDGVGRSIFKTPATDDGTKNSARGLLTVYEDANLIMGPWLKEDISWAEEGQGILQTIFHDGMAENFQTLATIRGVVENQL